MNIINLLVGAKFLSLIKDGRYTFRLTKTDEAGSLKCSSEELDYVLKNRLDRSSCPNFISIGILCFLFVILYIGGSGMILDYCDLPTKPGVLVSLSLITVISIIVSTIPYSLGRGYSFGLTLVLSLYLFSTIFTVCVANVCKLIQCVLWLWLFIYISFIGFLHRTFNAEK